MATVVSGVQYSGIWTMQQVNAAIAAGTWPVGSPQYLYSWGRGGSGQLGLSSYANVSSPNQVGSLGTWAQINAMGSSSLSIKRDGTLWSWGNNSKGQLGLGNITSYSSPKQIGALTNWSKLGGGGRSSLAIKTDGTLWAWGYNNYGQLGLGDITDRSSPVQVGSLTTWLSVACSYGSSFAVKTDGTLWSWGQGTFGQLGLGNTTYYSSPKQIGALTTWAKVCPCAYNESCFAIKADGTLWAWGNGLLGSLGLGNVTSYSSPKQIGALTNWSSTSFASLGYGGLGIKTDGTMWSWGYNYQGVLGLNNTTNYSSPKQVGALTTWSKVSKTPGYTYSAWAIQSDGTLWGWGDNSFGQLGLGIAGGAAIWKSPNQVGSSTTWMDIAGGQFALAIKST